MEENIKKLIRFLKQHNLFTKYVEEVKRAGISTIDATLSLCEGGPEDLLLYAFYWDKTQDGAEFWAKVDDNWKKFILSENKSK